MFRHWPMTAQSRGRLYTDEHQRSRLDCDPDDPQGTVVSVGLTVVDRAVPWGTAARSATFEKRMGVDGEITVPSEVRTHLDLVYGDSVRVSMCVVSVTEC